MTYTVYHIPGVKFGCTNDIKRRSTANRRKYGKDIQIDVIKVFTDIDDADEFEEFCNQEAGYEHQHTSYKHAIKAWAGSKHTEETKSKQSKKKLGELNPMYGKSPSQYNKDRTRETHLGVKKSKECCDKISKAQCGGGNSMAKPINIDGKDYACVMDAVREKDINRNKIDTRLKSEDYPNYQYT